MTMKRIILGCFVIFSPLLALAAPRPPHVAAAIPEVQVTKNRVHFGDVVPNAPADIADFDLGASPAAGGSRIFDRGDLAMALAGKIGDSEKPLALPSAVRVIRKMHKLDVAELEKTTRAAVATMHLWRGATLAQVKPMRATDVPEGWTKILIEIPKPPRRSGALSTNATLSFETDGELTAKVIVPVELALSEEAAKPEVAHGAEIQVVVRRGLIEVATAGVAGADGDSGDIISVTVRGSNRVLRARVQDATHVVALEGS